MSTRDIEPEVIDLVADERGLAPEKVNLSDRLLHDLGMDGDDAVDFFASIHERFGTDLARLHEHWSDHFGPEGFSCGNGLVIIPAAMIGGVVAASANLSAISGVGITVGLLAIWLLCVKLWGPPDRKLGITVADVVAAVEAGEWPEPKS